MNRHICLLLPPIDSRTVHSYAAVRRLRQRRSGQPAAPLLAQYDLARFEQRLEVGKDTRPTTGHRLDQLGVGVLDRVADGQLYRAALRFELDGAARVTLGRQRRPKLVSPFE